MHDLSLFDLRQDLPGHHPRWVRAAFLLAAGGYFGVVVIRFLLGSPFEVLELAMFIVCLLAVLAERRHPRLASLSVLSGVWTEMMLSYVVSSVGLRSEVSVALPLVIFGSALLLGSVAAWFLALASCVAVPVALLLGQHLSSGPGIPAADLPYLFVLLVTLFGSATLITRFLQTLADLMRNETTQASRFRDFIEQAPDAIIAMSADGTVAAFNRRAEEYLHLDRDAVLGHPMSELRGRFKGCFPSQPPSSTRPAQVHVGERFLETRIRQHALGSNSSDVVFVLRDVSEREHANRDTAALRSQLNQMQKMDAIGHLAGGVAHDFNNLLTAVSGAAHALHDTTPEETLEIAQELQEAADHGAALTRQLLTFARKDVVQEQILSLPKVLNSSHTLLSRLLGERIRLGIETSNRCQIKMDEGQLQQVLLNLAANARDAIAGPGVFSLRCIREGAEVVLIAEDNGCGMDPRTIERIFEPFFTTKGAEQGTGLGLSTTFGIVRQSGGEISVDSTPGEGSRFTIRWPFAHQPEPISPSSRRDAPRLPAAGRILLVEDNDTTRRFLLRILRKAGYDVAEAVNGHEALAMVEHGLEPDVLVSDVMMPGMSGVELAKRLHQSRKTLPVLFVSGYVDDVLSDCPYDPARDLLLKPFSAKDLVDRVAHKLMPITDSVAPASTGNSLLH